MGLEPGAAFLAAAREGMADFDPRGLEYLQRLIARLSRAPAGNRGVPAAALCAAFRAHASADFGALAAHVASRWGLASGADLGRAVLLLAGSGCLTLDPGESLEDYAAAGPCFPA